MRRRVPGLPFLLAIVIAGCAASRTLTEEGAPLARQVTASDHCGLTAPGLVYLSQVSDVNRLGQLPAMNLSLEPLKRIDFSREHLLMVGLGQQPTGGYGVALESAEISGGTLKLTVAVRRPPVGGMVTQALTTPCAVLAITATGWKELEVAGNDLTTMTRHRPVE